MKKKDLLRKKRHNRIKMNMHGTPERPRLVVHRSLKNLSAQIIDDTKKKTIFSYSTLGKEIKQKFPSGGNIKAAEYFGQLFAQKAKEKGITRIIFDRAGYLYHGRVKIFADSLRKGGLEF
ncbi:MAG: 50S ribosomal protein L18 [Candidatus Omnitrophica bacterium]|nr:50S ribosomal protein L18 [Candidatus Omnitrophota bacterium]